VREVVYLNGDLIPIDKANISILDYGFLYGYEVFETMRAYNGIVFRLDRHLNRLANSAQMLQIPVDSAMLESAVVNTVQANDLKEARIRLAVSIGRGSSAPDLHSCISPTVLVVAAAYTPYGQETYKKGYRAIVSSIRRNSQSPVSGMKTANYLENLLARREAQSQGMDEAIFLNEKNQLSEAATSNIFLVSKNILKTPGKESGILPGITRDIVLKLAANSGFGALETDINIEELLASDEIFLTNTVMEIMPVVAVNGKMIGSGEPGNITRKLMAAYRDLVWQETLNQ
jgi:branched-chain amino acid aminotransferase